MTHDYILWICLAGVTVIAVAALIIAIRSKGSKTRNPENSVAAENNLAKDALKQNEVTVPEPTSLVIDYEPVTSLKPVAEKRLVEIKDKKLLTAIDSAIPGTAQAVINSALVQSYGKNAQSAGQLYRAIIPPGEKLVNSRSMDGAVRGFTRDAKNITHHANFVAVENTSADKLATMNAVNAVMGVASMVVGQYYMVQINNRLDKISDKLDKVISYQSAEIKGKIQALVLEIQKASVFQYETLQNDEVRNRELIHLKSLEHECSELLGQVNAMLQKIVSKADMKYKDYKGKVHDASEWIEYQQILLKLLGKLGDLTYALNLGAITKQNAYALYEPYSKQTKKTLDSLYDWHMANLDHLGVNTLECRRKRTGIEKAVVSIPALFNDDLHYKSIEQGVATMINRQLAVTGTIEPDKKPDLFKSDTTLIAKDGKLYYLPPREAT